MWGVGIATPPFVVATLPRIVQPHPGTCHAHTLAPTLLRPRYPSELLCRHEGSSNEDGSRLVDDAAVRFLELPGPPFDITIAGS
jgi:hypothetical protein